MPHKKVDRARLFLSYDALKGFKEMLSEEEYVRRKELSEDRCYELDWKIHQIKEGDLIEITYYTGKAYQIVRGEVQVIDLDKGYIYINDQKINLKNLFSLEL